jgi:hypothetical protein
MVEKARKLPTFYDICARVKQHAERDRVAALFDRIVSRSWPVMTNHMIFRA